MQAGVDIQTVLDGLEDIGLGCRWESAPIGSKSDDEMRGFQACLQGVV